MVPKEKQAAQLLDGKVLNNGWKVVKKIEIGAHKTGGVYSCCYEVSNGDRKGFLKAFDYSSAEKVGIDFAEQLKNILAAYTFEREILDRCNSYNCTNVIEMLDHGNIEISEAEKYPRVDYLILEFAEKGDIRDELNREEKSMKWKMKSLHQLCKGLKQIHNLSIAHQDIKPSNIVTFKNDKTKITDFGSAVSLNSDQSQLPFHLNKTYSGSWEYAPPELLYGEKNSDPVIRRIGCDLYLLGSMIAFYFTNMSMTALIKENLQAELCWTNPDTYNRYNELRAYLIAAFEITLNDIRDSINEEEKIKDQIILMLRYLCHPDPMLRGHKTDISRMGPNYNLERFITMFDIIVKYYDLKRK